MRTEQCLGWIAGLLVALTATQGAAAEPVTFYGFDPQSHSAAAHEGMEEIFSGRLFHMGIPVGSARMMLMVATGSAKDAGYDPNTDQGWFFASGRFPSPPERTSGIGPSFGLGESVFQRDGVQMVNINCFTCHAGVVNGQVVAGLANNHVNQSDPREIRTRGDNFGPYEVWRFGSRLVDPANEGMVVGDEKTELETLFESVKLAPVDPMPWWLMKYKTRDYWYADAGPHDAASFSINFTTAHPQMNAHRADHIKSVAKALAFARETQSPPFPKALDAQLVQKGADLFHGRVKPAETKGFRTCKTCHGSYTKKPGQEDFSRPGSWTVDYDFSHVIRNVNTDRSYNTTLQAFRPIAEHINKLEVFFTAQAVPRQIPHASVPDQQGYVAPPLVGVWASAPYFHNGSVPTLDTVLNSKRRPEIWSREIRDPYAYDLDRPGLLYQDVSRSEFEQSAANAAEKRFLSQEAIEHGAIYDTHAFGHGNMGHTFGDHLTDEERTAVIEFLKSLSGGNMDPR
jgi:mono/diheme cytochrome c family protein